MKKKSNLNSEPTDTRRSSAKKCPNTEFDLVLSPLFIIQEIAVKLCRQSDNTENTKESILISESNGVNLRL